MTAGGRGDVAAGAGRAEGPGAPVGGRGEGGTGPALEPGDRVTAVAPSNIAFVKYWGARDVDAGVPMNRTVSMTLRRCVSRCTLQAIAGDGDEVFVASDAGRLEPAPDGFARPIRTHLDRLRGWARRDVSLRVATRNSFPSSAGLASSASGFAALTLAATRLLGGLDDDPEALSLLARLSGSGSAARSTSGGFVEWPAGDGAGREGGAGRHEAAADASDAARAAAGDDAGDDAGLRGPARQLAGPGHWELRDVIAVVDATPKTVPSREGHRRAPTSPHFAARLEEVQRRLEVVRSAIRSRDLRAMGPVLEEEAVELHLVAMSSRPPIFYWTPGTLEVLDAVRGMREDGIDAYFTLDAGPNVHVVCRPGSEPEVAARLERLDRVARVIRDGVGPGPRLDDEHLL